MKSKKKGTLVSYMRKIGLADITASRVLLLAIIFFLTVLVFLNYVFYQIRLNSRAASEGIKLTLTKNSSGAVISARYQSPSSGTSQVRIRVYSVNLSYTGTINSITYNLGVVSQNVGDSTIKGTGKINVVGESQDPAGSIITTDQDTPLVTLAFSGSPTITSTGGSFIKINSDSSLSEIPITFDGGGTVSNTPTNTRTPSPTRTPTTGTNPTNTRTPTPTPTTSGGNPTNTPTRTPTPTTGGNNPTNTPTPTTGSGNPTNTPTPTTGGGNPTNTPTPTTGSGNPTNTPTPTTGGSNPTPTRTPTPTTGGGNPTATPTQPVNGNIALNMKLKLQGVLKKPSTASSLPIQITLIGGPLGTATRAQTATFTVNDQGIWSANVAFNAPAGSGYKVLIKGPKHLQKRICDSIPVETYGGTYRCGDEGRISLNEGANTLDFSRIIQLVGDLPQQDGIVDAYDIALIRTNLGSTDANTVASADLNFDGVVDTQDYSLLIAALSVKYDEL